MTIRSESTDKVVWYRAALPDGTKDLFKVGDIVCASGPISPDPYSPHDSFNIRTDLRKILKISETQLKDPNYPPPEPKITKVIPEDMMEFKEGYYYLESVDSIVYFDRFRIGVYVDPNTKLPYSYALPEGTLVHKKNYKGSHLPVDITEKEKIIEQNKTLQSLIEKSKQIIEDEDDDGIPF
jgi:hypothetical protein